MKKVDINNSESIKEIRDNPKSTFATICIFVLLTCAICTLSKALIDTRNEVKALEMIVTQAQTYNQSVENAE